MKIKIRILLLVCLCLIPLFSLISCSREIIDPDYMSVMEAAKKPYIEVAEVGSYVKYKLIDDKKNEEVYLDFWHSEYYNAKDSLTSNEYYIIRKYEYLSPLDLKVGDKLVVLGVLPSSNSSENIKSIPCAKLYLYE